MSHSQRARPTFFNRTIYMFESLMLRITLRTRKELTKCFKMQILILFGIKWRSGTPSLHTTDCDNCHTHKHKNTEVLKDVNNTTIIMM